MQIRTDVTPTEVKEAIMLSRPRRFWLRFFAANWYMSLLSLGVIGVDLNTLLHHGTPEWGPTGILLAIAGGFIYFSWFRWNSKVSSSLRTANRRIESLSLDRDGVKIKLRSGASTFVPWSSYSRWIEGKDIFLLVGEDGVTIVPTDEGSRASVRGLLASQIG